MEQEISQLLKNQGFSNTKTRRAVLQAMLRTQPATIQQLITALPEVDRANIYLPIAKESLAPARPATGIARA